MIFHNALEFQDQIEDLLQLSLLTMNEKQIHAWMQYKFDPTHMFCMVEDNQVVSCIQLQYRTMIFKGKKCQVSYIDLAATHPDYQQRGCFSQLLDALVQQACCNDLLTLTFAPSEKLFESRSFIPVSYVKDYWLRSENFRGYHYDRVKHYQPEMDIYPIYQEFMSYFDGSILLDQKQFQTQIQYLLASHKKIDVMFDANHKIQGFAVYSLWKDTIHVETIIYLNSDAILDLFSSLQFICDGIQLTVSQNERLEKLFPHTRSQKKDVVLVRLNNYKLFSKWVKEDVRNVVQAFHLLEKPTWNHFM